MGKKFVLGQREVSMLIGLNINNFAIIKQLNIDFESGFTVITGETGAGKSIAIDALSLCMGYRSDVGMIRNGCQQAQVSASFHIDKDSIAYQWLQEKSLLDEDEPQQVIIRRQISASGPSKAFINEHHVSISFLKELTQYLVHLHGQHAPQLLLKQQYQQLILDRFINNKDLLEKVADAYKQFKKAEKDYKEFLEKQENFNNTKQLLEYKHKELSELKLAEGEYEELEQNFTILSNASLMAELNQQIQLLIANSHTNAQSLISKALDAGNRLVEFNGKYSNVVYLLDQALINLQEAVSEVKQLENIEVGVEELQFIEQRLSVYNSLAKKNQILPEQLYELSKSIANELEQLNKSLGDGSQLEEAVSKCRQRYFELAQELSQVRKQGALKLSERVEYIMQELNMKGAQFFIDINFNEQSLASDGSDTVRFMLNSNVGQTAQELSKVASGGELSRIALAIQLLTASHLDNGTLIFDEVDVGISGKTATVVGRITRQLSKRIQVLSVTHLAQVASYATNHFQVEKYNDGVEANTRMKLLDRNGRINALASLIGHEDMSEQAINNATFLLDQSQNDPNLKVDLVTGTLVE